jgi:hypothetical protein
MSYAVFTLCASWIRSGYEFTSTKTSLSVTCSRQNSTTNSITIIVSCEGTGAEYSALMSFGDVAG